MAMDQMGGRHLLQHLTNGLVSVAYAHRLPQHNTSSTHTLPPTSVLNLYAAATAGSNLSVPPLASFLQLANVNAGSFLTRRRLLTSSCAQTALQLQHPTNAMLNALPFCASILKAQSTPIVAAAITAAAQQQQQPQALLNLNLPKTNLQHAAKHNVPQGPPAADGNVSNADDGK